MFLSFLIFGCLKLFFAGFLCQGRPCQASASIVQSTMRLPGARVEGAVDGSPIVARKRLGGSIVSERRPVTASSSFHDKLG